MVQKFPTLFLANCRWTGGTNSTQGETIGKVNITARYSERYWFWFSLESLQIDTEIHFLFYLTLLIFYLYKFSVMADSQSTFAVGWQGTYKSETRGPTGRDLLPIAISLNANRLSFFKSVANVSKLWTVTYLVGDATLSRFPLHQSSEFQPDPLSLKFQSISLDCLHKMIPRRGW